MKPFFFILLFTFLINVPHSLFAQQRGLNDTIKTQAIIIEKDTLPFKWLREVSIVGKASDELIAFRESQKKRLHELQILRYNIYKTYPYAVAAAFYKHDIDSALATFNNREQKRKYKKQKEHELNELYKDELKNLSVSQGQVLVKLIARQTGEPCYEIIRSFKGGINARIAQIGAQLFDNNLKNSYDPLGDDAEMEMIVKEIEQRGHFERK